jgi:16S rRNA (guanine(966)-N(2))-methyltransferase RsmD
MRVISGIAKGLKFKKPKNLNIRITSDFVKESLFNILGNKVKDSSFLDLFAGIGCIGIEALSRGAKNVVFVEKDKKAVKAIKENLERLKLKDKTKIYLGDVNKILNKIKEKFDFIFLDPPYKKEKLLILTLKNLSGLAIFEKNTIIIVEHYWRVKLSKKIEKLILLRQEKHGDTVLSFYRKVLLYKEKGEADPKGRQKGKDTSSPSENKKEGK